jgi:hypothetical protein
MDADLIAVPVGLAEEGTHQIVLRTLSPDGRSEDADPLEVEAHPPPPPARALTAISYDKQNQTLTLHIEED